MLFLKWIWGKHRFETVYLICATSSTVLVFIGCIVNSFIESTILKHVLNVITITLNFFSAWFVWKLYATHFKRYYKEFTDSYPARIKTYKYLQARRDELMQEYPDMEPMPELPRPFNFARSYRKSRWIYFAGIALNIFAALFNILVW